MDKGDDKYRTRELEGVEVITENRKIYIPSKLQARVVAWYNEYLAHPGEKNDPSESNVARPSLPRQTILQNV